jgi:hypothetical protein
MRVRRPAGIPDRAPGPEARLGCLPTAPESSPVLKASEASVTAIPQLAWRAVKQGVDGASLSVDARDAHLLHVGLPAALPRRAADGDGTSLEQIGLPVKPRALLVGFAVSDDAAWPICVEPEYRFFQPAHLGGVLERTREIYENHPNYTMMHTDRRMHELYHQSLVDSCRAQAVVEALNRKAP